MYGERLRIRDVVSFDSQSISSKLAACGLTVGVGVVADLLVVEVGGCDERVHTT